MFNVVQSREFSGFQKIPEKIPEKKRYRVLKSYQIINDNKLKNIENDFVTETKMETLETFWNSRDLNFSTKKKSVTFFKSSKKKLRALCRESENSVFFQLYCITNENWTNIFVQFFKSREKVF